MSETNVRDYSTRVEIPEDSVRWSKFIRTKNGGNRLELGDDPMRIGKLALKFQSLDKNMKQTGRVTIYLDKDKALVLAYKILSDKLTELDKYGAYYTTDPMGTPASKLYGENSRNGRAEFRKFSILKGDNVPYVLRASKCDGTEQKNGLIMPYTVKGKPQNVTMVIMSMSHDELLELALNIYMWVQAYEAAQMVMTGMKQHAAEPVTVRTAVPEVDEETGEVTTDTPAKEDDETGGDEDIIYGDITSDDLPF